MHRWEDNIEIGIKEIGWEGEDKICPAEDSDQWQPIVNVVINLSFCKMQGVFYIANKQLAFQKGHCLLESVGSFIFMGAFFLTCLGFIFQEMNKFIVSYI